MRAPVTAVAVLAILHGIAHAQAPEPRPADPVPDPAPPPPDPVWSAYDDAFAKAASGDRSLASSRLAELAARWPQHPAGRRAGALTRAFERDESMTATSRANRTARGELLFWSTVGGIFTAANVCVIVDCRSDRESAAVYTLSVGGSLAIAALASHRGVAQGEAQLYNSAQTWAAWNALAINDGFAEATDAAVISLAAQGVGIAAGIGLWKSWKPTQGDVALTNSFLLWSTVLTLWGHLAFAEEPSLRTVVAAGDVGLLVGAYVSTQVKMSRGRTLLIDVGGILGILAGGLVAVGTRDENAAGVSLFLGTAAGLGIAAVATRDWDLPDSVKIVPARFTGIHNTSAWGVSALVGF
ncbi:MAG: hypothetical protein KIT31_00560 [Deltaproteobacteria bacterium]|nr:hypothetical protein [Deltaproteobacteria bacterium]